MALGSLNYGSLFWAMTLLLLALPCPAKAFGAGNIPSIAQVEGLNWRHGDIEDMIKTVAFIKGHKWTSMMVKRVYFGNWLRDYSQAVDVGSLKGVSAPTIRILVWVLSFLSFGYATGEFEVTEERLGVYRPEEHIDNPKDYADNQDARQYDSRLRGPVQQMELEIDQNTGMKNYIANESGGWATSSGYVRFSFARSIHFGRLFTNGAGGTGGREADLCEALRCLGQGLHCMEDFGAHTNYCELALRELGYHEVFPHCGTASEINLRGRRVYPLVTGTFGAVDFLHSVLGEATDHFTQSEVEELDIALKGAEQARSGGGQRGLFGSSGGSDFIGLLGQVPGMGDGLASTARDLQATSAAQEKQNEDMYVDTRFNAPPGFQGGPPGPGIPGMSPSFDPVATAKKIYPILEFRDRVVKAINATIAKIPGLEALIEKISEKLTLFIMGLLAPFVRPIIESVSAALKKGSSTVVDASKTSQWEPWNDSHSTNPTHSMLSKDHFSNYLNGVAGRVATTILQYVTPRILYAWQNPGVSVDEVMHDITRAFHHPANRDESLEIHRNMFHTVQKWVGEQSNPHEINGVLSSSSVKAGHNHKSSNVDFTGYQAIIGGHGKTRGSIWSEIQSRDLGAMEGSDGNPRANYMSPSTQPGPQQGHAPHSPQFGYQHHPQQQQQYSQGGHLNPGPPPAYYQSHGGYPHDQQQQPQYGGPPPQGYQQQQYGGPGYQQGPPPGGYWPQGPPPPGFQQQPTGYPSGYGDGY